MAKSNKKSTSDSSSAYLASDLAEAEAALEKAEKEYGVNHIQYSYRLDAVSKLLRSNKKDIPRAADLEMRAREIRKQHHAGEMTGVSKEMEATSKNLGKRIEKDRQVQDVMKLLLAVVLIFGIMAVATVLVTPEKNVAGAKPGPMQEVAKFIKSLNPARAMDENRRNAEAAAAQQKKRSAETDQFVKE